MLWGRLPSTRELNFRFFTGFPTGAKMDVLLRYFWSLKSMQKLPKGDLGALLGPVVAPVSFRVPRIGTRVDCKGPLGWLWRSLEAQCQ